MRELVGFRFGMRKLGGFRVTQRELSGPRLRLREHGSLRLRWRENDVSGPRMKNSAAPGCEKRSSVAPVLNKWSCERLQAGLKGARCFLAGTERRRRLKTETDGARRLQDGKKMSSATPSYAMYDCTVLQVARRCSGIQKNEGFRKIQTDAE